MTQVPKNLGVRIRLELGLVSVCGVWPRITVRLAVRISIWISVTDEGHSSLGRSIFTRDN